jgi:hypothetical protein
MSARGFQDTRGHGASQLCPPCRTAITYQRWDEERARATSFSFALTYQFLLSGHTSGAHGRAPIIVDLVRKAREPGKNKSWNAGYDAAMTAIIQVAVERGNRYPM